MNRVDECILDKFEVLFAWLGEWGIKQRWIELSVLLVWLFVNAYEAAKDHNAVHFFLLGLVVLIATRNSTDAERYEERNRTLGKLCRLGWVSCSILATIAALLGHFDFLDSILLLIWSYSIAIGRRGDGDKSKAKLSWDKIKQLFGTEWITNHGHI